MMTPMRTRPALAALVLPVLLAASPAWAVRAPNSVQTPAGMGALGAIVLLVVAALIVGVSFMSPRRTHQD